ncbi:MAG: hypothetical protein AB1758_35505, partial [Candidatus Eremiobacterota bacterium]
QAAEPVQPQPAPVQTPAPPPPPPRSWAESWDLPGGKVYRDGKDLKVEFPSGYTLEATNIGPKPEVLVLPEYMFYGERGRRLGQYNASIPRTAISLRNTAGQEVSGNFTRDGRKLKVDFFPNEGVLFADGVLYDLKKGRVESHWLELDQGQVKFLSVGDPTRPVTHTGGGTFRNLDGSYQTLGIPPEALGIRITVPQAQPLQTETREILREAGWIDSVKLTREVARPAMQPGEWIELGQERSREVEIRFASGAVLSEKAGQLALDGKPIDARLDRLDRELGITLSRELKDDSGKTVNLLFENLRPDGSVEVIRAGWLSDDRQHEMRPEPVDFYLFTPDGQVEGQHYRPGLLGSEPEPCGPVSLEKDGTLRTGLTRSAYAVTRNDISVPLHPDVLPPRDLGAVLQALGPHRHHVAAVWQMVKQGQDAAQLAALLERYVAAVPQHPEVAIKLLSVSCERGPEAVDAMLPQLLLSDNPAETLEQMLAGSGSAGIGARGDRILVGGVALASRRGVRPDSHGP